MNRTRFLVLLALANGAKHGYEISKFIELKSRGFFKVPFGSLYPVLHKLEAEKFLDAEWNDESEKPAKTYSITSAGKKLLKAEIETFESSASAISVLIAEGKGHA